jgi:DNA-binding response OmpR family regulator
VLALSRHTKEASYVATQMSGPRDGKTQPPRILVIDDDPTILELMKAILDDEGYAVEAALTGKDALQDGSGPPPALVVLDMFVPGISGAELADALRARYGPQLPILITSASSVDQEAHALGAYDYLPKPFDLDELLAAVRQGLDGAASNP